MDKGKLLNLLLIIAAVLVVTVFAFFVRFKASPDTETASRKARSCCCASPVKDTQKNAKE